MLCLDVLVSFIQAYVFTLLATIFISMSTDKGHGHEGHKDDSENVKDENKIEQSADASTPQ